MRCGAAVVVAAAVMRGERGVQALLSGLREPARRSPRGEATLRVAGEEMAAQHRLSFGTIQRLQDLLYETGKLDPEPGFSSFELDEQVRVVGLPTRPFQAPSAVVVMPNKSSEPWRKLLESTLRGGEAVPVLVGSASLGHVVLFGRDRSGALYAYDSAQVPGLLYSTNPKHLAALEQLLIRAEMFWGRLIVAVG